MYIWLSFCRLSFDRRWIHLSMKWGASLMLPKLCWQKVSDTLVTIFIYHQLPTKSFGWDLYKNEYKWEKTEYFCVNYFNSMKNYFLELYSVKVGTLICSSINNLCMTCLPWKFYWTDIFPSFLLYFYFF